jgi:hypothetical protein
MECCCCFENIGEDHVTCSNGHLFCKTCLKKYLEENLYGNNTIKIKCINCLDSCNGVFTKATIKESMPKILFDKYISMGYNYRDISKRKYLEYKKKRETVLLKQENEKDMDSAMIKKCPKCKISVVLESGCSKVSCSCRTCFCIICEDVTKDYSHYCPCYGLVPSKLTNMESKCNKCNKCVLFLHKSFFKNKVNLIENGKPLEVEKVEKIIKKKVEIIKKKVEIIKKKVEKKVGGNKFEESKDKKKIKNPATGRWVLKRGLIGQKLLNN